jgi:hypothetical protein
VSETVTRTINSHISDLFFSLDHNDSKLTDAAGRFMGWDTDKMRARAGWFRHALEEVMQIGDPPTTDAILTDFYSRMVPWSQS